MKKDMFRMPLNRDIVGMFLELYDEVKQRADGVKKISEELLMRWEKLSFIFNSKQQVLAKVDKLIKIFDECKKATK